MSDPDADIQTVRVILPNPLIVTISATSVLGTSGGGGTPGGSNHQIQYNNNGSFGGITSLAFDGTIPATATLNSQGEDTQVATALKLQNTTPATSNDDVDLLGSPALFFSTQTWNTNTGTSQTIDYRLWLEGGKTPIAFGAMGWQHRENGGAWRNDYWWDNQTNTIHVDGGIATFQNLNDTGSTLSLLEPIITTNTSTTDGVKLFTIFGEEVTLRNTSSNTRTGFMVMPHGTVASGPTYFTFFGTDYISDPSNYEALQLASKGASDTYYSLGTVSSGSGVVRPILIYTGANSSQLVLTTDGGVSVGTGTAAGSGNLRVAKAVTHTPLTVATLPTPTLGMVACVSDGDSGLAWGAIVVNSGSGATKYLVWYNGSNWTVTGK